MTTLIIIVIALHDLFMGTSLFDYIIKSKNLKIQRYFKKHKNEFKLNFPKIRYRQRILHAKVLVGP